MNTEIVTRAERGLGWITLDGPDRLNAIGSHTYADLVDAVRGFEQNAEVGAVVIHGTGRGFSAGADIEQIQGFETRDEFASFIHGFTDALDVLATSRLPIIAAIHGPAMGGGLELALACDLRIVTEESRLGLPESKLGVLSGAGGTQRLPRLIPAGIATEMLMTGEPVSGRRAHELGLANHVVTAEELLSKAEAVATDLLRLAPQVFDATKSLLRRTANLPITDGIPIEREVVSNLFDSRDGREGFAAFLERRTARFSRAPGRP